MLFERYATYTGSDPRRAPAALGVVPYVEQRFGGWYLRGGLRRWPTSCRPGAPRSAAPSGPATEVTRIVVEGGRASGVRLAGGGRLPADVVVANADAAHVYRDLLPQPAAVAPAAPGHPVAVRLRAAARRPRPHARAGPPQRALPGRVRRRVRRDLRHRRRRVPVSDPTIYISAPDDPAVRPDGHEAWFVLVNAPRHGTGPGRGGLGLDPACPARTPGGLGLLARPGVRGHRPAAVLAGAHAGRPGPGDPGPGRGDLRDVVATGPGRRSCGRPTASPVRACSWSAGPRIPAAGCRWSSCPPASSPASSAPPAR